MYMYMYPQASRYSNVCRSKFEFSTGVGGGGWGSENGSKDEGLVGQISHSIGLFIPPYKELQGQGQPTYLVL